MTDKIITGNNENLLHILFFSAFIIRLFEDTKIYNGYLHAVQKILQLSGLVLLPKIANYIIKEFKNKIFDGKNSLTATEILYGIASLLFLIPFVKNIASNGLLELFYSRNDAKTINSQKNLYPFQEISFSLSQGHVISVAFNKVISFFSKANTENHTLSK